MISYTRGTWAFSGRPESCHVGPGNHAASIVFSSEGLLGSLGKPGEVDHDLRSADEEAEARDT